MSNFFRLLKINVLSILAPFKKKKLNFILIITLIIWTASVLGGGSLYVMKKLAPFKAEALVLLVFLFAYSIMTMLASIKSSSSYLFNFKDYENIMSLPISRGVVVLSRIANVYISNLLAFLIMIGPAVAAYLYLLRPDIASILIILLVVLLIPIIPMIIGSILGVIISYISSFFKKSKFLTLAVNIAFIALYLYFYNKFVNTEIDFSKVKSMLDLFLQSTNNKYPIARYYTEAILDKNIPSLIIFILISLALLIGFFYGIKAIYLKLNTFLKTDRSKKHFNYKKERVSPFRSLVLKEYRKLISSPVYFINSLFGLFLILLLAIYLLIANPKGFELFLKSEFSIGNIYLIFPILISLLVASSCTTSSSISFEGKFFPMIKTLPIDVKTYLNSKLFVNLSINFLVLFITVPIINYKFKLSFLVSSLNYLIPLLYTIFIASLGLILNLVWPKFNFDNDAQITKQSLPAFITTIVGFLVPMILIFISAELKQTTTFMLGLTGVLLIFDIIIYVILVNYAKRRMRYLE